MFVHSSIVENEYRNTLLILERLMWLETDSILEERVDMYHSQTFETWIWHDLLKGVLKRRDQHVDEILYTRLPELQRTRIVF